MIVEDYKGRKLTLLSRIARKTNGHRYMTRTSVKEVILGISHRVRGGSSAENPANGWPSKVSKTRLKVGCHVFTGDNFKHIKKWALSN